MKSVITIAPASIGNLSVGFDLLGLALESIDGSPLVHLADKVTINESSDNNSPLSVTGLYADDLPRRSSENLVMISAQRFAEVTGNDISNMAFVLEKNLPVSSGLGSSAASITATLVGLNRYFNQPLSNNELLSMMGEMEAVVSGSWHLDNVAPSFLGGLILSSNDSAESCVSLPVPDDWQWV
ncbi:MAG: hypothetical protein V2I33_03090, partial [Kangiellaceae bacterium]|nr:hypothetical protein [Kangiellaceae bacterium]